MQKVFLCSNYRLTMDKYKLFKLKFQQKYKNLFVLKSKLFALEKQMELKILKELYVKNIDKVIKLHHKLGRIRSAGVQAENSAA